ncbi:hercynylcysteine sulfoxide lyase [compost metagenome]
MLGAAALDASLSLLEEIGMEHVASALGERVQWLYDGLGNIPGVVIHSPLNPARRAGIVSFSIDGIDNYRVYERLKQEQVVCIPRGPGVRFSPHFYTEKRVIDETLAIVKKIASR